MFSDWGIMELFLEISHLKFKCGKGMRKNTKETNCGAVLYSLYMTYETFILLFWKEKSFP